MFLYYKFVLSTGLYRSCATRKSSFVCARYLRSTCKSACPRILKNMVYWRPLQMCLSGILIILCQVLPQNRQTGVPQQSL